MHVAVCVVYFESHTVSPSAGFVSKETSWILLIRLISDHRCWWSLEALYKPFVWTQQTCLSAENSSFVWKWLCVHKKGSERERGKSFSEKRKEQDFIKDLDHFLFGVWGRSLVLRFILYSVPILKSLSNQNQFWPEKILYHYFDFDNPPSVLTLIGYVYIYISK